MTIRKSQSDLSDSGWDTLVCAMKEFKKRNEKKHGNNRWDAYIDWHKDHSDHIHGLPEFLPWHRKFILEFEKDLQSIERSTALPYWDWAADPEIPEAFHKKLFGWMHVSRRIRFKSKITHSLWPTRSQVDEVRAAPTFDAFWSQLEGIHNGVHVVIGGGTGAMSTARSPKDPLFFLHHAMVDKLWADWQREHDAYTWTGETNLHSPYENTTNQSLMNIADLGYEYRERGASDSGASSARTAKKIVKAVDTVADKAKSALQSVGKAVSKATKPKSRK
jgi:tyrosinase